MMLNRPRSCEGCPLDPIATGFMNPVRVLTGQPYSVALIGETLGEDEADVGAPFVGRAGFRLSRLIEWAGLERSRFDIYNAIWCRPPNNKLEGESYEQDAISHCKAAHWGRLLPSSRVLVPMGNIPTGALIGRRTGILSNRGYVYPGDGNWIIPTVHPSFIQRGAAKWSAPFINDLQKAVDLAANGMQPQVTDYLLDPSPLGALEWARAYRRRLESNPSLYCAFDIETPGKGEDEEDLDVDSDLPDRTWNIDRVGFSYGPLTALSIPWAPEYLATIRLVCESVGPKVVWNAGFDVPRLRRAGIAINGVIHDGMVAWHILHSDLPKKLSFVSTFTCPFQPAWKHLSGAKPAFYNATDADVEYRSMVAIEAELRRTGLWDVYQKDVLDLEPILVFMHEKGMPVDATIRLDRAVRLAESFMETRTKLSECVPLAARRIEHVYKKEPKDVTGLYAREGTRLVRRCSRCGCEGPRKDHFKRYVKKVNPCSDGQVSESAEECSEYYRLAEFAPSRDQMIRYHQTLRRPLPMVWDKKQGKRKVSFGERQIKDLIGKYPNDPLYSTIIDYRQLEKISGTYIGRPVLVEGAAERIDKLLELDCRQDG